MKMAMLMVITFLQIGVFSGARAGVPDALSPAVAQASPGAPQGVQAAQASGIDVDAKKLDITVTVDEPARSQAWYSQPIWIAMFVVGGLAVVSLLAMALRSSGRTGTTIVK